MTSKWVYLFDEVDEARSHVGGDWEKVRGLLESAGFLSVRAMVREFTHRIESEEFIQLRVRVGSTRQRLESMGEDTRRLCVSRVRERLSSLSAEDLVLRMPVIIATARHPG